MLNRRKAFVITLSAIALSVGALLGAFSYTSVCVVCGAEQHTTAWQIPLTGITYYRSSRTVSTALSQKVTSDGLVTSHAHDWHFAAGGGNFTTCAIGDGRHLGGAIASPDAAAFVDAVMRYHGTPEAQQFLTQLLTPERSHVALMAVTAAPFPSSGFKTRGAFDTWWNQTATEREIFLEP